MKIRNIINSLILVCTLFVSLSALAEDSIRFNTWSLGSGVGELYENRINFSDLMKLPSFNPEEGSPPIDPQKALAIAREYLKKKHAKFANSVVAGVNLTQFVMPRYFKDKWYYIIIFENNIPVIKRYPESINVVVMMDGSVNEPYRVK
jgi:hypothetical protein